MFYQIMVPEPLWRVPAHDERDFAFAKKYDLEIIPSIDGFGYYSRGLFR